MKFKYKVFFLIYSLIFIVTVFSSLFFRGYFSKKFEDDYIDKYRLVSNILGNTLKQLEEKTDLFMYEAVYAMEQILKYNGLPTNDELRNIAKKLDVSHLFIIDNKGKFLRSTKENPDVLPNAFSFCSKYQSWFNTGTLINPTGLVPGIPSGTPSKFLLYGTENKKYIIEIDVEASFLGQTLEKAISSDKNVISIELFSPNGTSLGLFTNDGKSIYQHWALPDPAALQEKSNVDTLITINKIPANFKYCCSCVRRKLTLPDENYYYVLKTKISKSSLKNSLNNITIVTFIFIILTLLVSIILSRLFANKIVSRIDLLNKRVSEIIKTGSLERIDIQGNDEIKNLADNFNKMVISQEQSRRNELTSEIAKKLKHELVRPIAKIQSIAEILTNSIMNVTRKEILDELCHINIISETGKLIIRSMFSYVLSSKDLSKLKHKTDEVILNDVINTALLFSLKNMNNTEIELNIPEFFGKNYIIIDKTFLTICFINIITNAYEAVFRNKVKNFKLKINPFYENEKLTISLVNYGSFIEKENFSLIFNPGHTSEDNSNKGHGLSILKDILQLYNGKVFVDSEKNVDNIENSWVEFKIEFNDIKSITIKEYLEIAKKRSLNNDALKLTRDLKILIADDELFYIDYFKEVFKHYSLNISVEYFLTVENAVDRVKEFEFDLAFVDLKFDNNEVGGYEIIKNIREKSDKTYIVVHSSYFFEDYKNSVSINEHVQKTITFNKVNEIIFDAYNKKYLNFPEIKIKNNSQIDLNKKIEVFVIDDENYLYEDWKKINSDCNFTMFSSYDDFFIYLSKDPKKIDEIDIILTDFYFDKIRAGLTLFTSDVLGSLRDIYDYKGFIILVSNANVGENSYIDDVVDKVPKKIFSLIEKLKNK